LALLLWCYDHLAKPRSIVKRIQKRSRNMNKFESEASEVATGASEEAFEHDDSDDSSEDELEDEDEEAGGARTAAVSRAEADIPGPASGQIVATQR